MQHCIFLLIVFLSAGLISNTVTSQQAGTAPDYMGEHCIPTKDIHSQNTRFREKGSFAIPKVKGFGKKSFAYVGCKLWNGLPSSITSISQPHMFKVAVKNKTNLCNNASPADIMLIIDGSGSVGSYDFNKSLQFCMRLVDAFKIGPVATQIALIVFHTQGEVEFKFNTYKEAISLKAAIANTRFPAGGTNITAAIEKATKMFKTPSVSGHRQGTTGIAILMTDGRSYSIQPSIHAAQQLKDLGVTIYTAGIGSGINVEELQTVASSISYYFNATDYNALEIISGPITSSACSDLNVCICYNGGTCTDGNLGYKCICPAVYTGFYCETQMCSTSPCGHGTCSVLGDSWYCTCKPGYTGTICNEDIDECASNPCFHGTCADVVSAFLCSCQSGYTGKLCEEDIDECSPNPCQNNDTCSDHVNSFTCHCAPGYTGVTCKTDIDECESSPCENGGTCHDWVNAFACDCAPGYYGIYCETASQTKEEFGKQLEFINHFIDHIIIGEYNFQVGIVSYSFKAVTEISLGEFKDNVTMKEAVRKIKYRPGATFTDKGLDEARKVFNNEPRHRPYGHIAKRFAFVLTDGLSTNRALTAKAAENLRSTVNKVLALGIGTEVSHRELLTIASSKDTDTGRKFVYSVQNFNALYTVVKELVHLTCEECYWKTSSGVVFLLDMSAKVSISDFQTGLNAITYLVQRTTQMENENNTVRIGLVTYGKDIQLQRAMDDPETKENFLSSIQRLVLPEGHCLAGPNECERNKLGDALKFAGQTVFNKTLNSTSGIREIVIVLSNGNQTLTKEIISELIKLRKGGKDIYVVALGENADIQNLKNIVGDPALIFSVYDESSTKSLDALMTEFFFSSCDLTNDFVDA